MPINQIWAFRVNKVKTIEVISLIQRTEVTNKKSSQIWMLPGGQVGFAGGVSILPAALLCQPPPNTSNWENEPPPGSFTGPEHTNTHSTMTCDISLSFPNSVCSILSCSAFHFNALKTIVKTDKFINLYKNKILKIPFIFLANKALHNRGL